MARKGQLLGQIVIYVLGLIVIGGVILFGYKVVSDLNEDRCEVQRVQFATQLSTHLERNRGWGTNKAVQLESPCETKQVCFVDRRIIDSYLDTDTTNDMTVSFLPGTNPVLAAENAIANSVTQGVPTNVFTIDTDDTMLPVERFASVSAPVRVGSVGTPGAACIDQTAGLFILNMQGTGSVVFISGGAP